MPTRIKSNPESYIKPLNMNRLEGRMLRLPISHGNEILFVGDLGSDLEYWFGLIRALADFGTVTMPDLPGMGGMDSFYKIGKVPSIDSYSDYLASFFKLRFKRQRIIIVAVGFGFVVATRMLERYPSIKERVKMVISLAGYADFEDFASNKFRLRIYALLAGILRYRPLSIFVHPIILNEGMFRWLFLAKADQSLSPGSLSQFKFKLQRLASMDKRSFAAIAYELSRFTNCGGRVDLPVWQVDLPSLFIDRNKTEQHLCVIFSGFYLLPLNRRVNRYPELRDKRSAAYYLPQALKQRLMS